MRLEILIGHDEPLIFPLNKTKMILGSADNCDIVVMADGVSRRHIIISVENDVYSVTDQGSTNGTFINEERLIPGRRVEFTSFFPVRLGDNVLLTLLSDEEESDSPLIKFKEPTSPNIKTQSLSESDVTTVINLKSLNQVKTTHLVKRRDIARKKVAKKKIVKKKPLKIPFLKILAASLFLGAFYYTVFVKEEPVVQPISKVGEVIVLGPVKDERSRPSAPLVDVSEYTPKEKFANLLADIKCTTELEMYYCENVFGANSKGWGVLQSGTMVNVMIDGTSYFSEARNFFKNGPTPEEVNKVAAALFVIKGTTNLDREFEYEPRVSVALYDQKNNQMELALVIVFYPKSFMLAKEEVSYDILKEIKSKGISVLDFTKNFYSTY